MKKIDFDVFSLITPLEKPIEITVDPPTPVRPDTEAFRFAHAIKNNQFVHPQIELLGKQMTPGPSPVRHLQFGHYEIPDYAIKKVMAELDKRDRDAMQRYLWASTRIEKERTTKKLVEIDAPFTDEAEKAFGRVLHILKQLEVMFPRQIRKVGDVNNAVS